MTAGRRKAHFASLSPTLAVNSSGSSPPKGIVFGAAALSAKVRPMEQKTAVEDRDDAVEDRDDLSRSDGEEDKEVCMHAIYLDTGRCGCLV